MGGHPVAGRRHRGRRWPPGASIADAAELAAEGTEPVADMHADADYRRHLARVLTRRALEAAQQLTRALDGAGERTQPFPARSAC